MSRNIYVASSWRNAKQNEVVMALREVGHNVYDFKNPEPGDKGFAWSDIDPHWQSWTCETYRKNLDHPVAVSGYSKDWSAMQWADTGVLVLPCGRSAHLEAGYFPGAGKQLFILIEKSEPELMYRMATGICITIPELLHTLKLYEGAFDDSGD